MDIMQRLAKIQWQLMKYGMFMGAIGGVFSFFGPLDSGMYNALLGVVVGGLLFGRKFEDALKELIETGYELADELFDDKSCM